MPCRDYYDDHPDEYFKDVTEPALKKQISFAESALCGVLNTLYECLINQRNANFKMTWDYVYDFIDYNAIGIAKEEFIEWHKTHLELDKKHREEEERALLQKAIRKLTPDEYAAIRNQIINGA